MQEEIVSKSVEVGFRISNITLDLILKGLEAITKSLEKDKGEKPLDPAKDVQTQKDPELKHGKQTLKQFHTPLDLWVCVNHLGYYYFSDYAPY